LIEDPLSKKLRATEHMNGQWLTLEWGFLGNASKNSLKKSCGPDDLTYLNAARSQTDRDWAGEKFIYHVHKSEDDFFNPDLAERLPPDARGYNKYDHYTKVAVFSAPNPSPASYAFMKEVMKLNSNRSRLRLQVSHAYQIICRTPMRDPNSTVQVTARVLTKDIAEAVGAKFAKCLIQQFQIEGLESGSLGEKKGGREKIYKSNGEKQKAYRERLKQRESRFAARPSRSKRYDWAFKGV
jgi:hypothetical protein